MVSCNLIKYSLRSKFFPFIQALSPDSDPKMTVAFTIDARGRRKGTTSVGIPSGYYGNAFVTPVAISTTRELCTNPMSYDVELVKKDKNKEYMA